MAAQYGPFGEIISPPDTEQYEQPPAPYTGPPLEEPPGTEPYVSQGDDTGGGFLVSAPPGAAEAPDDRDIGGGFSPGDQTSSTTTASRSISTAAGVAGAQNSATVSKYVQSKDWRVKIQLAPSADYLYKATNPGILQPLTMTDGVLFPYSPTIQLGYNASYDNYDLTHSNYKSYTYKNSSVEQVSIVADFTAQDTTEANYVLAVMHFFRSVTKMFYGKDNMPIRGTPPPLVYLSGYGAYNFDQHPMVVTSFSYTLPNDVDYISASASTDSVGVPVSAALTPQQGAAPQDKKFNPFTAFKSAAQRLLGSGLNPGAQPPTPVFLNSTNIADATRVPTKIQFNINCLPIITRYNMSNNFSLEKYSTGALLRGSKNPTNGGGVW